MSWLSKATGIHIKIPGLSQVGGAIDHNLPAIGGSVLGSAGGTLLGHIAQGDNIGQAIKGTAGDVGKAAAGAAGIIGLPGVLGAIPGVSKIGGALSHIPGASSLMDILKSAGGKIPGMLTDALSHPLETAGVISGALDQSKARGLQTEAINAAREGYDSRAPLRAKGMAGLLNPSAPDLSGVDYGSSGSVYGKPRVKKLAGVA
jgi:hypothetical protein